MNESFQKVVQYPISKIFYRGFQTYKIIYSSGQYYKHFTLVNYDSRVVIWGIFQSGTTLES